MKRNLLKTVIILIAVTFVTLQSCEKKAIVPGDENSNVSKTEIPSYEFSKLVKIADKNGVSADITVYSDNENSLDFQIEITPIYKKPNIKTVNTEGNLSDEKFDEKPPVHFDITNVKLPENAIGYKISHKSVNKWDQTIFGYGSDYDAGFVTKTNSGGYTKYKMGVLYTGSQWFYSTVTDGKLKSKNSAAQAAPGSFYKMYIKTNDKYGSTSNAYFYSF